VDPLDLEGPRDLADRLDLADPLDLEGPRDMEDIYLADLAVLVGLVDLADREGPEDPVIYPYCCTLLVLLVVLRSLAYRLSIPPDEFSIPVYLGTNYSGRWHLVQISLR
jgi:hypothetical protein